MAKKKNNNYNKGQETMEQKLETTAEKAVLELEEKDNQIDNTEEGKIAQAGDDVESEQNSSSSDDSTIESGEDLDAVDSEFKIVDPAVFRKEEGVNTTVDDSTLEEKYIELSSEQTPPSLADIKLGDSYSTEKELIDSLYPPIDSSLIEPSNNDENSDAIVLEFNKKTINELILNYAEGDIVLDENTSILNSEENQRARHLIKTLNAINTAGGDKIETKILSYLSLYMEPTDLPKSPGMLMQLIAKEINEAKTISDLDMAIFILTRIFTHVASFNIRSFLKIGTDYSAAFKVDALQMVEAFSQLSTAGDRKKKIGTVISLQKTFKSSTSFLNANGAKLMIEYFSK